MKLITFATNCIYYTDKMGSSQRLTLNLSV